MGGGELLGRDGAVVVLLAGCRGKGGTGWVLGDAIDWGDGDGRVSAYRAVEVDRATLATFCVNMAGRAAPARRVSISRFLQSRGIAGLGAGSRLRTSAEGRNSHPLRDHDCCRSRVTRVALRFDCGSGVVGGWRRAGIWNGRVGELSGMVGGLRFEVPERGCSGICHSELRDETRHLGIYAGQSGARHSNTAARDNTHDKPHNLGTPSYLRAISRGFWFFLLLLPLISSSPGTLAHNCTLFWCVSEAVAGRVLVMTAFCRDGITERNIIFLESV